jgi:hypothetical protein
LDNVERIRSIFRRNKIQVYYQPSPIYCEITINQPRKYSTTLYVLISIIVSFFIGSWYVVISLIIAIISIGISYNHNREKFHFNKLIIDSESLILQLNEHTFRNIELREIAEISIKIDKSRFNLLDTIGIISVTSYSQETQSIVNLKSNNIDYLTDDLNSVKQFIETLISKSIEYQNETVEQEF